MLRMQGSRKIAKKQRNQLSGCRALCCSCRLSVSSESSEEVEGFNSNRFGVEDAMVQEKLEQMMMMRERVEAIRSERRKKRSRFDGSKCIIMVAMDKYSEEPREDFRESMVEMIVRNQMEDPKELRCLLNCYMSMNSEEYRPVILEVFHQVCTDLFLCSE
uniref:Transcription repressor n=1 Tax=Nelumbo nucifera TaxID=4432 RepID=A0A822XXJ3_NELNU|nr:TPA_asm: hypothetical protein HUJ06_024948 [Nelumbo nucifera]